MEKTSAEIPNLPFAAELNQWYSDLIGVHKYNANPFVINLYNIVAHRKSIGDNVQHCHTVFTK